MHRQGWQRIVVAAAAIGGVLMGAAPATAQMKPEEINTANVRELWYQDVCSRHIRKHGRMTFEGRTYPSVWVESACGEAMFYEETRRNGTSLYLTRLGDQSPLSFNLNDRTFSLVDKSSSADRPSSGRVGRATADTCVWGGGNKQPCLCDLRELKPLQGAVGAGEVAKKEKDIEDPTKLAKEKKDLHDDPIKVIQGADGILYVTDHHHGAAAWIKAGYQMGICVIQENVRGDANFIAQPEQFYKYLAKRALVRLRDPSGHEVAPTRLPRTVADLDDDPYRTLAWMVRRGDGFCRTLMSQPPPEFAEFKWADAMRNRPELPLEQVAHATAPAQWQPIPGKSDKDRKKLRDDEQKAMLDAAKIFAASPEAAKLPGYNGTRKLKGDACNP